jgi:hypothetical protein
VSLSPGMKRLEVAWARQAMVSGTVRLDKSTQINSPVDLAGGPSQPLTEDAGVRVGVRKSRSRSVNVKGICRLSPVL